MSVQNCPICGKEYDNGRKLHGHLMKSHHEEYRAAGFSKDTLICKNKKTAAGRMRTTDKNQNKAKPSDLRLLNLSDQDEADAYKVGYRYIDSNDLVYTHEEAKEEGWI